MSFWLEQAIARETKSEGEIINSIPVKPDKWQLESGLEYSSELDNTIEFINKYYSIDGMAITCLSPKFQDYLQRDHVIRVIVRSTDPENRVVGTCFSILMSLRINGESVAAGYTTYLCVHPDYTKKGLASSLIRKIMVEGNLRNMFVGYHITSQKIGENAIPIVGWWYPANHKLARTLGFRLPISGSHDKIREYYQLPSTKGLTFEPVRDQYLDWLQEQLSLFAVTMNFEDFLKFVRECPGLVSYVVCLAGKPVSFVSWYNMKIHSRSVQREIIIVMVQFFINPTPGILRRIISMCDTPVIYFYEVGHLNPTWFRSIKASPTQNRWLNWYNWSGTYKPSEIILPFL